MWLPLKTISGPCGALNDPQNITFRVPTRSRRARLPPQKQLRVFKQPQSPAGMGRVTTRHTQNILLSQAVTPRSCSGEQGNLPTEGSFSSWCFAQTLSLAVFSELWLVPVTPEVGI